MYVKTLTKTRFADMAYFKRDGESWIPLDEYGERTKHTTFNHFCIFDWLDEGVVEIVKNPVFKQNIQFPLVVKSNAFIWVMKNEDKGFTFGVKKTSKAESFCSASLLLFNCTNNPEEYQEVKGEQRDLILKMYEYAKQCPQIL